MIGSSIHPVLALEVARAEMAAHIQSAEDYAAAAEMRRDLRAARAEARRDRRSPSKPTKHHRPVLHLGRFTHGSTG